MAQTYLTKTFGSSGNLDVWTVSFWVKKSLITTGNDQYIMHAQTDADNQTGISLRGSGDDYQLQCFNAVSATANNGFNVYTSMAFKDDSAWYHIVVACDTTEASGSNGLKMYVNGTQVATTVGAWNQNVDTQFSKDQQHVVGAKTGPSLGLGGYLSQFIFANGTQYAASTFGSTNANGMWISNSGPSVTYGSNGFKLDFVGTGATADASGFGADTSGNGNHFASTNLGTNPNVTDTPENNFCTLDSEQGIFVSTNTFSEGNTKIVTDGSASYCFVNSTMGFGAGKWYWEMKYISKSGGGDWCGTGVMCSTPNTATDYGGGDVGASGASGCYYYAHGQIRVNGATPGTYAAYSAGDIVSVAMDCDNEAIYFAKNGVWQNSGVPTSGASKTGAQAVTSPTLRSSGYMFWVPGVCGFDGAQDYTMQVNFGNPAFAISSTNADANGYGNFEYAVPSGYYAVCSKNIGQYG